MRQLSGDARSAVFAPLDDGLVRSEVVVRRLSSAIALGLLAEGEQLPTETELATSLNISSFTLRDALADLRDRGLVVTRRGRTGGTFVCTSGQALDGLLQERLQQLSTSDLRELGDHRAAITGAAAHLAAKRASATEIRRLLDIVDRLGTARRTSDRRRLLARFYVELAAAAQSMRLTLEEIDLQSEAGQMPWPAEGSSHHLEQMIDLHRGIVEAISDRDSSLARSRAEASLAAQTEWLAEQHLTLTTRTMRRSRSGADTAIPDARRRRTKRTAAAS